MPDVFYLETGSQNPYYNLALEEIVLERRREGDYLILWQNDNTVVVGQNQNTEAEIDRAYVESHHVRVVRRPTGGGAVYHDLGNLNYSYITDLAAYDRDTLRRLTAPVVSVLQKQGLPAELSGRNDILLGGKKVSGTAQRILGSRILLHGTLLFSSDGEKIARALRADPEKFRSKGVKSVRARVGNISDFLAEEMDIQSFWTYLKTNLFDGGLRRCTLSEAELQAVEERRKNKFETFEWNFGQPMAFSFQNKAHWQGGHLEISVLVERAVIKDVSFHGDFLSLRPLVPVEQALRGVRFRQAEVNEALRTLPLEEYFGGITRAEIVSTLFDCAQPAGTDGTDGNT